jgi:transketolase
MSDKPAQRGQTVAMNVVEAHGAGTTTSDKPFGRSLVEAAKTRPEIVGLTADLGKYTDLDIFGHEYPNRYFQIGMAEQNLVGVAAGLASTGFVPFATTYCVFASRRAYDFIAIDVAYARANVKIVAGLPGLTTGYGATHQGIDDLALMRAMPGMVVIDPADATEIEQAVPAIADYAGPVYMRLLRGQVKRVLAPETYRFEIGKARLLRNGRDVLLISTGLMTDRALEASAALQREGIDASVLHVSTLKPLDAETIVQAAALAGTVVTVENHSVVGGLGSAVADVLCMAGVSVKMAKIGVPDQFVECGSVAYLVEKYGMTAGHIVETATDLVERRNG